MFYVYILWSDSLRKFYVGHTADLEARVDYHNRGNVTFTRTGVPWTLAYSESHPSRSDAMKREAEIKRWKSAASIRRLVEEQRSHSDR